MSALDRRRLDHAQAALLLARRAVPVEVSADQVARLGSLMAAINLCMTISGLDDKEICAELGIDPGHFSKITRGTGHFPPDKLNDLMTLCGNEAPLRWLAHSRGYGLVILKTEADRRAEEAEARAAEAERKLAWVMEMTNFDRRKTV